MYSLVLMAAMAGGADAPSFFWWGHGGSGHWGGGCYGGCWGGCYGGCGGWHAGYGCYGGCYGGCFGGCGGCFGSRPVYTPYRVVPAKPKDGGKDGEKKPSELGANRTRIIIEVPEDAKVFVDDMPTKASGTTTRVFTTPALEPGNTYYYIVRVETVEDGNTIAETQRLVFRPGAEVRAAFRGRTEPADATASAPR